MALLRKGRVSRVTKVHFYVRRGLKERIMGESSETLHSDNAAQIRYRDARFTNQYDTIWQNVGKCVFCDLRAKYVVHEEHGVVLTITLFAYIDGHLMIVPRRHITSPKEFTPDEWEAVRKCMYLAKKLIKKAHGISGVQFVQKDGATAQSTVGHIHYHAVPFDAPDLSVWNYRRLSRTPLENATAYQQLHKDIRQFSEKFNAKYQGNEPASQDPYNLDWSDLAFGSKKAANKLQASFIAAPRELSPARFTGLVKQYLPKGNILLGLAKEPYVDGFNAQPQFAMLRRSTVQHIIGKINASKSPHKLYTLNYFQRDLPHVLEKLDFRKIIFVNGSWARSFHLRPEYYVLANRYTNYELVSPFASDSEAKTYAAQTNVSVTIPAKKILSQQEMAAYAAAVGRQSYDHTFQTGVALGKKSGSGYRLLASAFNAVVPYQTYAMHHGASREQHFSPPNDLNHYDTNHAEVNLLITAQQQGIDLRGTTLFINLLPCPPCARMLSQTDITEIVYAQDHSDGYAVSILEACGKRIHRITTA